MQPHHAHWISTPAAPCERGVRRGRSPGPTLLADGPWRVRGLLESIRRSQRRAAHTRTCSNTMRIGSARQQPHASVASAVVAAQGPPCWRMGLGVSEGSLSPSDARNDVPPTPAHAAPPCALDQHARSPMRAWRPPWSQPRAHPAGGWALPCPRPDSIQLANGRQDSLPHDQQHDVLRVISN
jgi:hypothetical protein